MIAGGLDGHTAPTPPPDSWASQPGSEVAIWLLRMDVGAVWTVPAMSAGLTQVLHFYSGDRIEVDDTSVSAGTGVHLDSQQPTWLRNVGDPAEILLLQGRPIGAPVFQMGPFVMNTPEELQTAFADYRRTQFGGWPWPSRSHVHPQSAGRFALHADGRVERRDMQPVA